MELDGIFEPGEYGSRAGRPPRPWHDEFMRRRENLIAGLKGDIRQQVTSLYAGTGAGKTDAYGLAASADLNLSRSRRIVVLVPSKPIAHGTQEAFRKRFGIHLALYNGKQHPNGVTSDQQGYIVTCGGLVTPKQVARHRRITKLEPTTLIIDEVHHLGDGEGEAWGEGAKEAFENARFIVAGTGSPFRPAGGFIPFVTYIPTDAPGVLRFKADHEHSLGRSIIEGHCREPEFRISDDAIVVIPREDGTEYEVSFKDQVSSKVANQRLTAAVGSYKGQNGHSVRMTFLRQALAEIKAAGRKAIIFLGGDTAPGYTPTEDALDILPGELEELGYGPDDFMSVTQEGGAHKKIKEFRESKTHWILITINCVSEGVDIPELSAAIFLTTWTSELSLIQRLGRVLRFTKGIGDFKDAWIYVFGHPKHSALAIAIKEEMRAEAALREKRRRETGEQGDSRGAVRRADAIAISGGELTVAVWNGETYPYETYREALSEIEKRGLSKAFLEDLLKKPTERGSHDSAIATWVRA